jgi:hypothetical protein
MSEHAVRMLRNILKVCSWKLNIHPVTCSPSSSADLNVVGRNCISANKRWAVCYDCMCVYFVLFFVEKIFKVMYSIMTITVEMWAVNHSFVVIN